MKQLARFEPSYLEDVDFRALRAEVTARAGDLGTARRDVNWVAHHDREHPRALFVRAEFLTPENQLEAYETAWAARADGRPPHPELRGKLDAFRQQKLCNEIGAAFVEKRLASFLPQVDLQLAQIESRRPRLTALGLLVERLAQAEAWDAVERYAQLALKSNPSNHDRGRILLHRARAAHQSGKPKRAVDYLEECLRLLDRGSPDRFKALKLRAALGAQPR